MGVLTGGAAVAVGSGLAVGVTTGAAVVVGSGVAVGVTTTGAVVTVGSGVAEGVATTGAEAALGSGLAVALATCVAVTVGDGLAAATSTTGAVRVVGSGSAAGEEVGSHAANATAISVMQTTSTADFTRALMQLVFRCSSKCPPTPVYVQSNVRLTFSAYIACRARVRNYPTSHPTVDVSRFHPLLKQDSVCRPGVLLAKKVCRPKSLAHINPAGLKSRSRQIWFQYAGDYSQSSQALRVRRPRTARRLHRLQTGSPNEASCRSLRPSQSGSAHRER